MENNISFEGCMNLMGGVIGSAVDDYKELNPTRKEREKLIEKIKIKNRNNGSPSGLNKLLEDQRNLDSASFYLFSKNGLEKFLSETRMNEMIDIDFIRRKCLEEGGNNVLP